MPKQSFSLNSFSQLFLLTIKENSYFFWAFFVFLLLGGLVLATTNHGDVLLYFSDNRTPFANFFFKNATKLGEELGYILLILLFLFIRYRFALLILLSGIIVTIVSFLSKRFFLHPRPSVYYKDLGTFQDLNLVDGVYVVSGLSSFPSGHTMSAFALFTLIALMVKNKKWMGILLFSMALSVGLSRVYLVQHFLKDIYLGGILGVFIALILYNYQLLFPYNEAKWIDKKIKVGKYRDVSTSS